MRSMLTVLFLLTVAMPARATDGVLEINQTCAVQTGCFSGDTPGFPVTIIQPGSYRLTSSLDLSAEGVNVNGVAVSVSAVTVDLAGFHIVGPTSCSGSGGTIDCSPSSTGVGSAGVLFTIDAAAGVVQNGIVRNMTNFGILGQGRGLRVQGITAIHNGRDGISGWEAPLVVNSVAIENGQNGISVKSGSVVDGVTAIGNGSSGVRGSGIGSVVSRTSARNNGMHGFHLGSLYRFGKDNISSANPLDDDCGGGMCTGRRRLYMTTTSHPGNEVLNACGVGFHLASVSEVVDAGDYQYDTVLGRTRNATFHFGPTWEHGWVSSNSTGSSGNCDGFTTASSTKKGFKVRIQPVPVEAFNLETAPAQPSTIIWSNCSSPSGVWCIESGL